MLKNIIRRFRLHLSTLYITLGMIWGVALFGFILFEILMRTTVINEPEPEIFQMGFLMAFLMYIGATLFSGGITSYTSFNIAISMGSTRKKYIINRTLFMFICNLIALLCICLIYHIENLYLNWQWPGLPLEIDFGFLMKPYILLTLWIVGTIVPLFLAALTLRFGKVVSITLYITWLVACLGCSNLSKINPAILDKAGQFINILEPFQWGLVLSVACIPLYAIAYRLYKKQAVVA